MSTRQEQKQKTRQAFFDAVLNLCMTGQSFSSISLRQVTREVGVVPTAFYRHFDDMESLGKNLVEHELGTALAALREFMQFGKKRSFERQIATNVQIFFEAIDSHPHYWQFIASERFGGSEAVRHAINNQIAIFANFMSEDLALQPAFAHINKYDRTLLAETGINLSFSWIRDWLDLRDDANFSESITETEIASRKKDMLHRCTRQTQMLFYGAYNWQSSETTLLKDE
ncbi:TetR family transcriptional regulator [Psychrobacter sp. HD31]|uniref:TetR family transcriptional regulator n=1 Tax=Psychrobacter sp. HD31 TaxID=3112003 RepID=UPI003DA348C2